MPQLNPNIFIQFEEGEAIVWDYKNHTQYSLNKKYLNRLIEWSKNTRDKNKFDDIDKELLEANLLINEKSQSHWKWDILSHIFHYGTQNIPLTTTENPDPDTWVKEYLDYCEDIIDEKPNLFTKKEGVLVDLPQPDLSILKNANFLSTLKERQTSRVFKASTISLKTLSTLLFASFGLIHGDWSELTENELSVTGMRKASASGGGLHPEEAYVIAFSVEGLEPGVYHYRVHDHKLTILKKGDFEETTIKLLYNQYFAKNLCFGVFITARFDKAWWKYRHSRAYRNVLLDIGHVSQTFQLCATALNYNTWITGAFKDSEVDSFLNVDGETESSIFFVGAGVGERRAIDDLTLKHVKMRPKK